MLADSEPAEMTLPEWDSLSDDDKKDFDRLRMQFFRNGRLSARERRAITFGSELELIHEYIRRTDTLIEVKSILTGICFSGRVLCINTRQLKTFMSRCKSSVNASFQQLGYLNVKAKPKAKEYISTILPKLDKHVGMLRQWSVRVLPASAPVGFKSLFRRNNLPKFAKEDLHCPIEVKKKSDPPPRSSSFSTLEPPQPYVPYQPEPAAAIPPPPPSNFAQPPPPPPPVHVPRSARSTQPPTMPNSPEMPQTHIEIPQAFPTQASFNGPDPMWAELQSEEQTENSWNEQDENSIIFGQDPRTIARSLSYQPPDWDSSYF